MSRPTLSVQAITFAAEDPGEWTTLLDRAVAADAAGVDRLVVSDHVAFGENLGAYADPALGGMAPSFDATTFDGTTVQVRPGGGTGSAQPSRSTRPSPYRTATS